MGEVFKTPEVEPVEAEVLHLIDELREQLRFRVAEKPRRWAGHLRRTAFARAVQASNSIEGYDASLDDVLAAVDNEPTLSADEETRAALGGYRDAMTYVLQLAQDPGTVTVDEGLLKSLHFMMLKHRLDKNPGQWRPGAIYVRREATGEIVYEGPGHDRVSELVAATVEELERSAAPVLIRAAMAHLNLVMVHPFSDGNGRMARCLQTLVLAREQIVAPVFSSIEEYLGRNTDAYYKVLGVVGQGRWNPHHTARPWVRFCLTAHYHQARTQVRRIQETERLYIACCELAEKHGLPERAAGALAEVALGFRLRNSSYRAVVEITSGETLSDLTASRDRRREPVQADRRAAWAPLRGATSAARRAGADSSGSRAQGDRRSVRTRARATRARGVLAVSRARPAPPR
jgi:Fic family protein